MKVELLVPRSGPKGSFSVGDVIDVSKAEAKRMMETEPPQAQPIRSALKPERADKAGA